MSGFGSSPPFLDPYSQQQPAEQAAYTAQSGRGSVGPVIGVLAVITILGAVAVLVGRRIMGRGSYDFEGWVESKCGSCINGRVDPRIVVEHTSPGTAAPPEEVSDNNQHNVK